MPQDHGSTDNKPRWKSASDVAQATARQATAGTVQTMTMIMPPVFMAMLSKGLSSAAPGSVIGTVFAVSAVVFFGLAAFGAKSQQKSIRNTFNKTVAESVTSPREKNQLAPLSEVVNQRPEKDMALFTLQDFNPKKKPLSVAFGLAAFVMSGSATVAVVVGAIGQCAEEYWHLRKIRNQAISLINE